MPLRIVATLAKLLERFDPEQFRLRESASDPVVPFEHEYPGKAGLSWVRHEHFFQPKNRQNRKFYNRLTTSDMLRVFMGRR